MDVHNTATPSFNMSRIKGKNTKPELKISEAKCWCGRFFKCLDITISSDATTKRKA